MDEKQFQKIMSEIGTLTPTQFKTLMQAYASQSGQDSGRIWSNFNFIICTLIGVQSGQKHTKLWVSKNL